MPILADAAAEIAFRYRLTGDPEEMITTIGYTSGLGGSVEQLIDAGQQIELAWHTHLHPAPTFFYANWTYVGYRLTMNPTGAGGTVVYEGARNVVGGASGGSEMLVNTAMLIKKLSGSPGRANRGRMYLPMFFLQEGDVTATGTINSAVVTLKQDQLEDFAAEVATGDGQLVINHALGTPAPTPITQLIVDSRVATQRRRLRP